MRGHAAAAAVYVAVAVAVSWPLALRLTDAVPNDLGDPLLSTWTLWWNATLPPLTEAWWNGRTFYPARDTLTLSDHRLGLGFITTPLIRAGFSPLAAYNVAFLSSFFLSAMAAYALGLALTARRGAAFIAGLVFGFNPFRSDHLSHLELLCSYWLPVALLALHRWADTRRGAWLVLLSVALVMQAFTSGYYFAFFGVLVGLWLIWFLPGRATPVQYAAVFGALAAPLVIIAPVVRHYRAAHASMGLSRTIVEIESFSADALGLLTAASQLALWKSPPEWYRPEGALYPGVVAVSIVALGVLASRSTPAVEWGPWVRQLRRVVLILAAGSAVVALIPVIHGPAATEVLGVRVSVSRGFKPLTIALTLLACWAIGASRVRAAWRTRSTLGFYVLATIVMWLLALGPTGRLMGERVLYKAPYAWLMLLPGFDTAFRVPARFGMLAALTLSAATAVAAARLLAARTGGVAAAGVMVMSAAVIADSWIEPLVLRHPPARLDIPSAVPPDAPIVELPIGTFEDAAAMYRSIAHGHPTVNGLSGYTPPHYQVLQSALAEGRVDALRALAGNAPLALLVHRKAAAGSLAPGLEAMTDAARVAWYPTHDVLVIPPSAQVRAPVADLSSAVRVRSVTLPDTFERLELISDDGHRETGWRTPGQKGGEEFTGDLGRPCRVDGVLLGMGRRPPEFPRALSIALSFGGGDWTEVWTGEIAALAVATAIVDPRNLVMSLPFESRSARYVRVRQLQQSDTAWAVSDFGVVARCP